MRLLQPAEDRAARAAHAEAARRLDRLEEAWSGEPGVKLDREGEALAIRGRGLAARRLRLRLVTWDRS